MASRTENMMVDIDAVPEGKDATIEIEFLRRLKSWTELFVGVVPKSKLLRYIVVLYSHDSFLNKRNPIPLAKRKQSALKFAEIEGSDEVTNQLLLLENELILKMVLDFLIAQRHNLWTDIVTTEQQYEEAIRLRLKPIKDTTKDRDALTSATLKKALRLDSKEMQHDLDTFYRKFYTDHNDVKEMVRVKATSIERLAKSTTNA